MPFSKKKKHQVDQAEQENIEDKGIPTLIGKDLVDKPTDMENRIVEKECQREIRQLEILGRMRKDPSWNLAVDTILLCEKKPSDAELIAAAINRRRVNTFSRFQRERYIGKQKPSKEE